MRTVFDGSEVPLISLSRGGTFKYCPLLISLQINHTVIPLQTLVNYCPQDTTGFYTFDNPP